MLKRFKKKLNARSKDNRAASATIEFLFVILVLVEFTVAMLDAGIYFNDRSMITNAAQQGARLTSIYGGSGNTTIAQTYGVTSTPDICNTVHTNGPAACQVAQTLNDEKQIGTSVNINSVTCYVSDATSGSHKTTVDTLQDRPTCSISFTYYGIAGSPINFVVNHGSINTVTETSNAEVIQNGN